jgi:hypothetical protein
MGFFHVLFAVAGTFRGIGALVELTLVQGPACLLLLRRQPTSPLQFLGPVLLLATRTTTGLRIPSSTLLILLRFPMGRISPYSERWDRHGVHGLAVHFQGRNQAVRVASFELALEAVQVHRGWEPVSFDGSPLTGTESINFDLDWSNLEYPANEDYTAMAVTDITRVR